MKKSLTFQTVVIAFGKIVVSTSSLGSGMLLSRYLSLEDYGTYRQVLLIYNLLFPILTTGISNSVNYYLPQLAKEKQKTFLCQTYFILMVLGFAFSALLFWGADLISLYFNNPALKGCLQIFSLVPLLTMSTSFYQNYFICLGKAFLSSFLSIGTALLRLGFILFSVFKLGTLTSIFQFLAIYSALEFGIITYFLYREAEGIKLDYKRWSFKKQLKFAFPISLSSVVGTLTKQVDKIIISSSFSTSMYAVYANGAVEIPLIHILTGSAMAVLMPEFVRLLQQGEKKKLVASWHNSINQLGLILLPCMVFLYAFSNEAMSILFSNKYLASVPVFRVYLFTLPMRVTIFGSVLLALGRPKSILKYSLYTLVANLFLSLLLVKKLGFLGPAWATVAVIYLMDFFQLREIARQLGLGFRQVFPWLQQFKILVITLISLPLPLGVASLIQTDLIRFLTAGFTFLFCYGLAAFWLGLVSKKQLIQLAKQFVSGFRGK
ncbi:MAG TPA: polysaccharide biosynthesis protein [Clostridia bacterium]|nr:polysaccharide biosynthesis protein [Clostridia bacterium]